MAAKKKSDEMNTEIVMKKIMTYTDANEYGLISAGDVAKIADLTAELLASSYSKRNVVTAHIDPMSFKQHIRVNDKLIIKSSINYVKNTSMEIGVRVEVERNNSTNTEHVTSAYLVLVAVDDKMNPVAIPALSPKSAEQNRRFEEGNMRMEERIRKRGKKPRK